MPPGLVTQHFFAPGNVGDVEDADGSGIAGSVSCGAVLRVSLKVDEEQRISDAKFRVAGCSYLVATCSILSAAVIGRRTGDAAAFCQAPEALIAEMDSEWPADKAECVALACKGFVSAIKNYSDRARDQWSEADALICTCFGVSERTIETAIHEGGLRTIAEVTRASNAGAGCRSCYPLIEDILDDCSREAELDPNLWTAP